MKLIVNNVWGVLKTIEHRKDAYKNVDKDTTRDLISK